MGRDPSEEVGQAGDAHVGLRVPLLLSRPDGVSPPASHRAWPIIRRGFLPRYRNGGDERARTADPYVANVVLSQLSYIPTYLSVSQSSVALAERQGFEPWERSRAQRFSRPPRSTTPAPLRRLSDIAGDIRDAARAMRAQGFYPTRSWARNPL